MSLAIFFYRSVRPHIGNKKNGDSHIPRAQVQVWGWHTDLCEHKQLLLLPMDAKHTYHTHTHTHPNMDKFGPFGSMSQELIDIVYRFFFL